MIKKLGLGCAGLIVVLAIIGAISGGGSKTSTTPATGVTPAPQIKTTEAGKSGATAAQPTQPPKPTEGPKLGSSRTAAVPFGEAVTLTKGNSTFEVRILEVQRDATAFIKKVNPLNSDPKEGWIAPRQVPKDGLDEIVLSWGKDILPGGETWFALNGSKVDSAPVPQIQAPPAPTSSTPGAARGGPVALGQAAKIGDSKSSFEVSVLQVERDASAMVKKANMLNPDPPAGMEYIAVKIRLKYLTGPQDKPVETPSSGMSLFAMNRMWGTQGIAVPPSPKFGGQDIFPGAVVEGWIDPILIPKEAMDEALLSYGKDFLGGGETWFALKQVQRQSDPT